MDVLIKSRKIFLSGLMFLAFLSLFMAGNVTNAGPKDPAPISEELVKSILQNRPKGNPSPYAVALIQQLENTAILLNTLEKKVKANNSLGSADIAMLNAKRLEIESVKLDIWNHFAKVRAQLETLGLNKKVKVWNKKQNKVESRFDKLQSALDAIVQASSDKQRKKAIKRASKLLYILYKQFKDK